MLQELAEPTARSPTACSFRRALFDNGQSFRLQVAAGMRIKEDLDSPNRSLGNSSLGFGEGADVINPPLETG